MLGIKSSNMKINENSAAPNDLMENYIPSTGTIYASAADANEEDLEDDEDLDDEDLDEDFEDDDDLTDDLGDGSDGGSAADGGGA
jgi:hypothetical protein